MLQLLQKLRDSVNVKKYAVYVAELEERAKSLAEAIVFFINTRVRDKLVISYSDLGYIPAHILYGFTLVMDPDKHVVFEDTDTVQHYVVPYRENFVSILFSTDPYNPSIINYMQTSRVMGNETLLLTVKPGDERFKQIYSSFNTLQVDVNEEIEASIIMSIATYYACIKLYSGKLGSRGTRLFKHGEEGLSIIIEELISKYIDALEKIVYDKPVIVSSPAFLKPASIFATSILDKLGLNAHFEDISRVGGRLESILLLATTVDEHLVKRLKFRLTPAGVKINEIIMNTDPLEAHIYLILLLYYLIFIHKQ
ncbi:MAG: hypothetical protein QXT88_03490 [Desulfurococcaceae archaeon]